MIRDGFKTEYTDEDKKNLVIRLHTPEEIKQCKRRFAKRQWKRRIIIFLLFILFYYLSSHATNEDAWFWLVGITMMIAVLGVVAEFITIPGAKRARSPHYIELLITKKLGMEYVVNYIVDHSGNRFFYPVEAMDTTSNYLCRYYLFQDEYNSAETGQVLKVNVIPKQLAHDQRHD